MMNEVAIKYKICKGMVCSFDPYNELKQKENGINYVVIIRRKRYKPFNQSLWICKNIDNDSTMTISQHYLKPANVCLIRYPITLPEFNNADLSALKMTVRFIENEPQDKIDRQLVGRLKAIISKIKFSNELRDI